MKLIEDLTFAAKVAAANDKEGIAVLCMRAISVIEDYSRASQDLCEATASCDIVLARDRLIGVVRDAESA